MCGLNERDRAQQAVEEIAHRVAADCSLSVVAVEIHGHPGSRLVRVLLYKEGGIGVLDLQKASREISAVLDVENPIDGHYTLEVSSPGLDRPLKTQADFARAKGHLVRLQLRAPSQGRLEWTGTASEVTSDSLTLALDNGAVILPLSQIASARMETTLPRRQKRNNDKRPRRAHA